MAVMVLIIFVFLRLRYFNKVRDEVLRVIYDTEEEYYGTILDSLDSLVIILGPLVINILSSNNVAIFEKELEMSKRRTGPHQASFCTSFSCDKG